MSECFGKDIRKIVRVGECLAITLPREYLRANELKLGDKVELIYDKIIHIEPVDENEIRRKLGKGEAKK